MTLEQSLLHLENAGWQSLCDSTGHAFYGELMTPDALMILAGGMVMTRADVIASLAEAPPWARYEIESPNVISLGNDAAVLMYTGHSWRSENEAPDFTARMSSTYARQGDAWKLALYQQTLVANT